MSRESVRRHNVSIPISTPQDGQIGGHAPRTYVDLEEISDLKGIYTRYENGDPIRFGEGVFSKRKPWIHVQHRQVDNYESEIVRMGYQAGVYCRVDITQDDTVMDYYDILWCLLLHPTNTLELAYIRYRRSTKTLDSTKWDASWTRINAAANNLTEPGSITLVAGDGEWQISNRGCVIAAMGPYIDSYPLRLKWFNRDYIAPFYDGFFADPNNLTGGFGGRKRVLGGWASSEKPTYYVGSAALTIYSVLTSNYHGPHPQAVVSGAYTWPLGHGYITNDNWAYESIRGRSGKNYAGEYDFWVCPIDIFGNEGPPILTANLEVSDESVNFLTRGRSFFIEIKNLPANTGEINPFIKSLAIYKSYRNVEPTSGKWTQFLGWRYLGNVGNNRDEWVEMGYGLDKIPESFSPRRIATIELNGKQFIPSTEDTPTQDDSDHGWPRNPFFNYFPHGGDFETGFPAYATRTGVNGITLDDPTRTIWFFAMFAPVAAATAKPYIEIEGIIGAFVITSWADSDSDDRGDYERDYDLITLTFGTDVLPDTTAWPTTPVTRKRIRFCCPWQAGTNVMHIGYYDDGIIPPGPPIPMRYAQIADADNDLDRPHYRFHAENPSGDKRAVVDVRNSDGTENKHIVYLTAQTLYGENA